MQLEITSSETSKLYNYLSELYELYKQKGISPGIKQYIPVSDGFVSFMNTNKDELFKHLNQHHSDASNLLSIILQWMSSTNTPNKTVENIQTFESTNLQQLNSIIGLSSLKSCYSLWEQNKENQDEEFWQGTLATYSFVLSQIFAYPIVIMNDKAYVGGKNIGNKGGKIVDFWARNNISKNATLIEIKTPVSQLLGTKMRDGVYAIHNDLSASVVQIASYKHNLQKNYLAIKEDAEDDFYTYDPDCIVIIGNSIIELSNDKTKRRSFELFRSQLKDIRVITYDEMFNKIKLLINLLEGNAL